MSARKMTKVPITKRALIQRMNRILAKDDLKIFASRGARMIQEYGDYHMVNISKNHMAGRFIQNDSQLEEYARELNAIAEWEHLASD